MPLPQRPSRRDFLRQSSLAGLALGFPALIPASALGKDGAVAPSNRLEMVAVGTSGMGGSNLGRFLGMKNVQVVAVCDVDLNHLKAGVNAVKQRGGSEPRAYQDYRELLAKEKAEAASIGVPDHWHAPISIPFLKAGYDIYGEKPLAKTLVEGRAMVDAAKAHGRVWQTGMWQRSTGNFRRAVELVRNGAIGKVKRVEVGTGSSGAGPKGGDPGKVPGHLNYDLWVGPSAMMEYDSRRTHFNWRWNYNFGGGQLVDWVCHHVDIAAWGVGKDLEYPVAVEAKGSEAAGGPWDAHRQYDYTATYADGTEITCNSRHMGAKFIGETGWISVNRGSQQTSDPKLWDAPLGDGAWRCPGTTDNWKDFTDCVRTRRRPVAHIEVAHHTTLIGLLANASILAGRRLTFDGKAERVREDIGGNPFISRKLRDPYGI